MTLERVLIVLLVASLICTWVGIFLGKSNGKKKRHRQHE
jgi:hypothetical protein